MRCLLFWLFLSVGSAQDLTIGVKSALRLTSMPAGYGTAESRPYRFGPAVEIGLPLGLRIEADALYSRLGHTLYFHHIGWWEFDRARADAWEFPILAKFRVPARLRPTVFGGIAPRHARVRRDVTGARFDAPYAFTDHVNAKDHAWVFGGGAEITAGHLRVGPEIRFLHTDVPEFPTPWNLANYLPLPRNEVALFVGLGWSVRK